MKRLNVLLLACLLLIKLTGCSSTSPETVAKEFTIAFYKGDIKKAKSYCTEQTQKGVDFLVSMMGSEDFKENLPTNIKVKATQCKLAEDGESAIVYLDISGNYPGKGERTEQNKLPLVKKDGKWKVVINFKN